ncbi:MAG: type II toxin-antitoxin system HicA family toxin [Patescibacteria group bacterium]
MAILPLLSARVIVRALLRAGYFVARQRGSHIRLTHPMRPPVSVPNHPTIGRGLLRKILRDARLGEVDFLRLLGK